MSTNEGLRQIRLARSCFCQDEYREHRAVAFAETVGPEQKLFLPFALTVLKNTPLAEKVEAWTVLGKVMRRTLGCPKKYISRPGR